MTVGAARALEEPPFSDGGSSAFVTRPQRRASASRATGFADDPARDLRSTMPKVDCSKAAAYLPETPTLEIFTASRIRTVPGRFDRGQVFGPFFSGLSDGKPILALP
jgi:hypothetical protein